MGYYKRNPMKSLTKSENIVNIVKSGKYTLIRHSTVRKKEGHLLLYSLYLLYFYILLLVIKGL